MDSFPLGIPVTAAAPFHAGLLPDRVGKTCLDSGGPDDGAATAGRPLSGVYL